LDYKKQEKKQEAKKQKITTLGVCWAMLELCW